MGATSVAPNGFKKFKTVKNSPRIFLVLEFHIRCDIVALKSPSLKILGATCRTEKCHILGATLFGATYRTYFATKILEIDG